MGDQWAGQGFGWQNMFVAPEEDPRDESSLYGEREVLAGYLRAQRQTLELKCGGLTPEQLALRSVPPSELSLLGLVRHMAAVEHSWFQRVMQGDEGPRPFRPNGRHSEEFSFAVPADDDVEAVFGEWRRQCEAADAFIGRTDLDVRGQGDVELREVIVHMIEEYARHNGHADLLRECIDGRRGQ
ncbi:DinB family protein [Actinoplanes flavus]|uniref:DinB family protein n=1 Tax=Actinoplanes flavus TaxID=2820290 RepID=A0ABS3UY49_9ACTN|nr:DinB family protein [Actinoplanes flavus]MBO3743513.1 DinB family protein [Actinoplanes flavus]